VKQGWELRGLGEVCDLQGGSQPPKSDFRDEQLEGYIRLLQIRDFKSDDKAVYVPVTNRLKMCDSTDIMIARYGASVGQIHTGKAGAYNVALMRTIPDEARLCKLYLYYYLISPLFQKPLALVSKRGAQDGFNKDDINPFQIPLPPLDEQKRIVAVLDEAFEGFETARTNTEANLKNAEELFQSSLNYVFSEFLGVDEQMLETIVEKDSPITYGVVKPGEEGDVLFVRGGDLKNGVIAIEELRTITKEVSTQYKRTELRGGEVLLCLVGQPGQTGVVPDELNGANIARQTALIRPKTWYENRFLSFFLLSPHGQARLGAKTQGAIQQVINLKDVREIKVPCPSYEKQKLVSNRLTIIQDEYERFKHVARLKRRNIEELRQSLLQKAFAGELT
jgi:type I restriction enzyme S subunit